MIRTVFQNLEGSWSVSRTFNNGTFTGKATFREQDSQTLHYREDGTMVLNGSSNQAYREYLYKLENEGITAYFCETPPRLFHHLVFRDEKAEGIHVCDRDTYKAEYYFESPEKFTLTYVVKGPEKDYSIFTIFQKIYGNT